VDVGGSSPSGPTSAIWTCRRFAAGRAPGDKEVLVQFHTGRFPVASGLTTDRGLADEGVRLRGEFAPQVERVDPHPGAACRSVGGVSDGDISADEICGTSRGEGDDQLILEREGEQRAVHGEPLGGDRHVVVGVGAELVGQQ
jgi:hypothetical protein